MDAQLLTLRERVFDFVFACYNHSWSWPQRFNWLTYPAPFDAHQSCVKCGRTRYFNSVTMLAGPVFKRRG
jgi:hypothetical protein